MKRRSRDKNIQKTFWVAAVHLLLTVPQLIVRVYRGLQLLRKSAFIVVSL